jgi:hypothetical protein
MKRIIITAQDEVGVLANITEVLAKEDINLESINTEGRGDSGLVILTTEECDRALHVLMNAGYRAVTDDALIIKLRDEPGALAKVAARFRDAAVNIQSLHLLNRHGDYATVIMTADDRAKAEALLDSETIV